MTYRVRYLDDIIIDVNIVKIAILSRDYLVYNIYIGRVYFSILICIGIRVCSFIP